MNYISGLAHNTRHQDARHYCLVKKGIDYPHYHHNETRPEECHAKLPACLPSFDSL